jgi:hypothetical protein
MTLDIRLRRAALVLALLIAGLVGLAVSGARAQAGLHVTALRLPEYEFGQAITFSVLAASDADITDVTLLMRTADQPRTFVGKARFERGAAVEAVYVLELGRWSVEPFALVEYWWELEDSAGNRLTTETQSFRYEDNRFEWERLTEGPVSVAWYNGDREFGQTALDVAVEGLARANRDLRAPTPEQINVYIYANTQQAEPALRSTHHLWADGRASPVFGVIVVTASPDDLDLRPRLAREIPHELTHILIYRAVGDRYTGVPAWLNEGLAVMNETSPDPDAPGALAEARDAGQLFPLARLCQPFPTDAAQARIAYIQSESVVHYIRDRYGARSLSSLLAAYADGLDCESGVARALGLSLADLEQAWLGDRVMTGTAAAELRLRALSPWLAAAALALAGPIIFFVLTRGVRPTRRVV